MASAQDLPRTVLPIPDREHQGLTTFDAKDPDTHYQPIQPCDLPPPPPTCW
jgi:arylsulfatase